MIHIDTTKENSSTILTVNGDVDASSSIQLDEALKNAISNGAIQIIIDCTHLNYISSAGLGVFMSYIEDLREKGVAMVLFGLNEKVMNVFEILGLDQLLKIVNTKKEAQRAVNAAMKINPYVLLTTAIAGTIFMIYKHVNAKSDEENAIERVNDELKNNLP